jgi:hypothetical protein
MVGCLSVSSALAQTASAGRRSGERRFIVAFGVEGDDVQDWHDDRQSGYSIVCRRRLVGGAALTVFNTVVSSVM